MIFFAACSSSVYNVCICDSLNLHGGLQSTLRKVIPASVARLERIQKLS